MKASRVSYMTSVWIVASSLEVINLSRRLMVKHRTTARPVQRPRGQPYVLAALQNGYKLSASTLQL